MRFLLAALALLLSALTPSSAFTVGYLLPSYICGPPTDGLPKSLGTFLPHVMRLTIPNNNMKEFKPFVGCFDSIPSDSGGAPTLVQANYPNDGGTVFNTQLLLGNIHNANQTTAFEHVIIVSTVVHSQPTIVNQIVPGQLHEVTLTITPNPNVQIPGNADDIANIALDGAVVYALNATGARVGSWPSTGPTMQVWGACGLNNVGIVHNQLISCFGQYPDGTVVPAGALLWQAPGDLLPGTNITFTGAAVSDVGYGKHSTSLPIVPVSTVTVGALIPTPSISKIVQVGGNLVVFYIDTSADAPAVNQAIISTSCTASVVTAAGTSAATSTVTSSPAIISLNNNNGLLGQTITATVQCANNAGKSSISTPVSFQVGATAAVSGVSAAVVAASICNATALTTNTQYGSNPDPDNSCKYLASTLGGAGGLTGGAAHVSSSLAVIAAALVAAFSLKRAF